MNGLRAGIVIFLCFVQLAGCVVNPGREEPSETAELDALTIDVQVPAAPSVSLLKLPVTIQQELDQEIDPKWSEVRKFRVLRKYLFDEGRRDIQYDASATGTAEETWHSGRGNCLSITNLFVASARYLGIGADFQTVSVRPTWLQAGRTMIRYEHIVAVGQLDTGDEYIVDFLPEFSASGKGTKVISDEQAQALYYNNLGAEAIVSADYQLAVEQVLKAIKLWPGHSDAWNNLGAAYRRQGEKHLAELSFKRSLRLDRNNYSALANLTQFYLSEGRDEDAEQFLARVDRYYRKNPYFHYYWARLHFASAEYEQAKQLLTRAIRLKRDDAEFYKALSETYAKLGNAAKSEELAIVASKVKPIKRRYRGERKPWARTFSISKSRFRDH